MLLIADIGNTNITLGVFDNENLVKTYRINTQNNFSEQKYIDAISALKIERISSCFIGSVVDEANYSFKNACDKVFGINSILFENYSEIEILSEIKNPTKVGADRIANAYASTKLYPQPSIILDLGSATTFDIISKDGKFFGGIIMPGINMQLNSLCEKTSKLPKVEAKKIEKAIGFDTETAILSGVIRGQASAIDGLLEQCEKEIGSKVTVVATGGLNCLVSEYMDRKIDYVNENLTLEGFKFLYDLVKTSSC